LVAAASTSQADTCEENADCRVYWRTFDNGAWETGGWKWVGYPGTGVKSAPAIASWAPGRLDFFVRGADDYLWHRRYVDNSLGATWHRRGDGWFTGKPSAVSWGDKRIDIVVRGMDGSVWRLPYDNGWGNWARIGGVGTIPEDAFPTIASYESEHLVVLARGMDGLLWSNSFVDGAWLEWDVLGGILHGDPAAVGQTSPKRIDVMAAVDDNTKTCMACDRGVWWKYYPYVQPCYKNGGDDSCGCHDDGRGGNCYRTADPNAHLEASWTLDGNGNDQTWHGVDLDSHKK
jgi:hypothetical protein